MRAKGRLEALKKEMQKDVEEHVRIGDAVDALLDHYEGAKTQ